MTERRPPRLSELEKDAQSLIRYVAQQLDMTTKQFRGMLDRSEMTYYDVLQVLSP
jgi:hypothetical protein